MMGIKPKCSESLFCVPHTLCGEGNGNPLQYSCLKHPMDGGAWAAIYGVAQSRTRLKRFSSSSTHFVLSYCPTVSFIHNNLKVSKGKYHVVPLKSSYCRVASTWIIYHSPNGHFSHPALPITTFCHDGDAHFFPLSGMVTRAMCGYQILGTGLQGLRKQFLNSI